jgi:RHS repeat-associated protein
VQEKWTLPFGTGATCAAGDLLCFTSYERSKTVAPDYAENRDYHFSHARFIQPDPIEMAATSPSSPQSFNLYAYVQNDPINRTDPTGLYGFGEEIIVTGSRSPAAGQGSTSISTSPTFIPEQSWLE